MQSEDPFADMLFHLPGGLSPVCDERVAWPGGLSLDIACFLTQELDERWHFSSARGVVLRGKNEVLVVQDPTSTHILPGGRIEKGETLEAALRREIAEETGWTIRRPTIIGFLHYHPLDAAKGEGLTDFLQAVFVAVADEFDEDSREVGGHELAADFVPLSEVRSLPLTLREHAFLDAAVNALRHSR